MKTKTPHPPGTRFGMLTVVDFEMATYGKGTTRHRSYRCVCECGKETKASSGDLRRGHIVSCGCFHKKQTALRSRKYPGNPSLNAAFYGYRATARRRGIPWELSSEAAKELFVGACTYCGTPPSREVSIRGVNHKTLVNGIDRKDSTLGYTPDNCVSCCSTCNYAKRDLSINEWEAWLRRIVEFQVQKNG